MKCFEHRSADAVGACKWCGRGVCGDCAASVGRWIACRNACEADVASLAKMVDRGRNATRRAAAAYLAAFWVTFVLAAASAAVAIAFPPPTRWVFAVFSVALFGAAFLRWGQAVRRRAAADDERSVAGASRP